MTNTERSQKLFATLESECAIAGLQVTDRGNGHWQVFGGEYRVNVYPFAKYPSAYINGMNRKVVLTHPVTAKSIIHLALHGEAVKTPVHRRNTKVYRREKLRMFKASPACHWCAKPIPTPDKATVDHRIPLSKGGLDHANNMVLACKPCNQDKADKLPHQVEKTK